MIQSIYVKWIKVFTYKCFKAWNGTHENASILAWKWWIYGFCESWDKLYASNVADLIVVENFSDFDVSDEDIIDEAQDTLTILSSYVESLNVENKIELDGLMRSLYNEALTVETVWILNYSNLIIHWQSFILVEPLVNPNVFVIERAGFFYNILKNYICIVI